MEAGGTGPPSREQWRPSTRTTTARQAPDGRDAAPQAARTAGRTEQRGKAERTPTTRETTRTRTAGQGTPHRRRRPGAKAGGRRDGNRQGAVRSANQVARGPPATSGPRTPTAPSGGPHLDRKGTQEGKVAITRQCESGPAAEERATGPAEATGPGRSAEQRGRDGEGTATTRGERTARDRVQGDVHQTDIQKGTWHPGTNGMRVSRNAS